jgi:trans-aconitate methyltransferase
MDEDYFSRPRAEVRALVPMTARFVVDVGCGAGALGAALKEERPGVEVRGIEVNREAAARAERVLDDVAVGTEDVEMPASWPVPDCVIFADVLEHMIDPWSALRRWRSRVREAGCIVVSLPNVAHSSVLRGLREGRWDYEDEGLLDRTHLRFFTRATALEMLAGAGFEVEEMVRAIPAWRRTWRDRLARLAVRRGLALEARHRAVPKWMLRILDSRSRQVLLRARAGAARSPSARVSGPRT